ncbi:TPA: Potassium transporter, variant 2 [Trebouxia sp. C0004]
MMAITANMRIIMFAVLCPQDRVAQICMHTTMEWFADVVVGISVAVIVVIFCLQRLGSSRIGFLYSPVLITWFLVNATIGVYNIIKWQPDIFKAVSPSYAVRYFQSGSRGAWLSLGGCVLCITGSEAMFADMGHFSHKSILIVALGLVYPSVLLIYFGEAAYLMHNTQDFTQSYFKAIPKPMYWPCFVIATAGALIGSQSLITSTFSIVRQAMRLNCFPPVKILHTGSKVEGQIYIPVVNWLLGLLTLACVLIFRSNTAIGNGFGVAVVAVMCITTLMASICMLLVWRLHPIIPFVFWLVLTFVEGIFLTSVLYKIPDGGWFPLALAAGFFFLACLWFWGMTKLLYHVNHMASRQAVDQMSSSEKAVDGELHRASGAVAARARGLAIYPTHPASGVPVGFLHLMRTMPVLHDATIFLTMRKVVLPHMGETERFEVRQLKGRCVYEVSCLYGFRDTVTQDRAFLQAMLCNICEDARYRAMAARSSAVDIYDQKEKADWKTLCIAPDAAVQKEGTLNAEVVLDVEVGPIEGKARSVKAAAVQLPQVSGQDKIAPPAATPAAATTAAPVQKQIQADCWHAHAEQMLASLQHDDEHWISGSQNSPANQQQPSSSQGFVEEELKALQTAAAVNVICVESQMAARAAEGTSWLKRIFIEYMFGGMCIIARSMPRQSVQTAQLLEIEVPVYL